MSLLAESVSGYLENASWIRRMFEAGGQLKARYGAENVYDFSLGNPDLPAPAAVGEGLRRFAEHAGEPFAFGYMPNAGFPWAREQLAAHLSKEQGVALEANDVLLTCGAAGGLNAFLRAVINPGEKMLTFAPYFVEYGFYVANHGGSLQAIMSKPGTFEPDLDALEEAIDEKTRVVLINSPHNPTGVVYSRKAVTSLCRLLENKSEQYGHPIWLIADEPYREIAYADVEVPWVPAIYENTVVCYSWSKSLSLPGERIGYVLVPNTMPAHKEVYAAICGAGRALGYVCAPAIVQKVVEKCCALPSDVAAYATNRDILLTGLRGIGYECVEPEGAFYLWVRALEPDAQAFSARARDNHELLLVPSDSFGMTGWVRISYCVAKETIENSLPAFKALFDEYQG